MSVPWHRSWLRISVVSLPLILRLDVGFEVDLIDQKLDDIEMAVESHEAQYRLSSVGLHLDVGFGVSLVHQKLDRFQMAKCSSLIKRSSAVDKLSIDLEVFQVCCYCVGRITFLRSPLVNQIWGEIRPGVPMNHLQKRCKTPCGEKCNGVQPPNPYLYLSKE